MGSYFLMGIEFVLQVEDLLHNNVNRFKTTIPLKMVKISCEPVAHTCNPSCLGG
jgi:hypothetical protein